MKRIVLFFAVIAALSTAQLFAADKPLIVSTIKPIHALVAAISGDNAETELLIPDYASPHQYSLKPSEIRLLNKADLVVRIDDHLETFLEKSMRSIDTEKLITLSQVKGLTLLSANHDHDDHEGEEHDVSEHKEDSHTDEHHEHEDKHEEHQTELEAESIDYHLWLSPKNAALMAAHISKKIIAIDPSNRTTYELNTKQLIESINKTDEAIVNMLAPVKDTPFLVMHDAWQYFTNHYQLKQLDSITLQERLKPSAKALSEARQTIKDSNVRCIVTELGVKMKTMRVLTEDIAVNTTEIDPMGRQIPVSKQAYPALLDYTAKQLVECLTNKTAQK
jgi:zinc transport system substrate-binding protein